MSEVIGQGQDNEIPRRDYGQNKVIPHGRLMTSTSKAIRRKIKKGAKFDYEFVKIAARLVSAGLTETDLGYVLGVKPTTINKWKQRYEEFRLATASGSSAKDIAKSHMIATGIRSAMGYDYEEVDIVTESTLNDDYDPDDKDSTRYIMVEKKRTTKLRHRPPDKDLLLFFLINMDRGQGNWKNVKSIEVEQKKTITNVNLTGQIESEDIRRLAGAAIVAADKEDRKVKMIESEVINED
jgi:hypothetical protein